MHLKDFGVGFAAFISKGYPAATERALLSIS